MRAKEVKGMEKEGACSPQEERTEGVTVEKVREVLKEVYDPEIPLSVVDLGLVDEIKVEGGKVEVKMLFTAPGCPMMGYILGKVKQAVEAIPGVEEAKVELVRGKSWTPDRLTEEGREKLKRLTGMTL